MAKAKKLPSGNWRVRVFSHKDKDGKLHYESFTAPSKAEAEMLGAQYAANKKRRKRNDLTISEAIDGYIKSKTGVLSPSTIKNYMQMANMRYDAIGHLKLSDLDSETLQMFISTLSQQVSPKTVRNVYGLLSSAIGMYEPNMVFRVSFPAKKKVKAVSPSDEDVKKLYEAAGKNMKIYMGFAMIGLRRGEICALTYEDVSDGVAHVHSDMVEDPEGGWIIKETPKTSESDRYVKLPAGLLEQIGTGTGRIATCTPNTITECFGRLRDKLGLSIRFHDLRHYFASVAAVIGVPDIYAADMGGWSRNAGVMKAVYQNNIKSMSEYYADKMAGHMDGIMGYDTGEDDRLENES